MCCNVTDVTLYGCKRDEDSRANFWTAGQRVDKSSPSTFVWIEPATGTRDQNIALMNYKSWNPGQPDYTNGTEACVYMAGQKYLWNDCYCHTAMCSVCEIDM